jgi:hypothetical protein
MNRRAFISLLGAAAWPLAARAQQDGRVRLIGWLDTYDESDAGSRNAASPPDSIVANCYAVTLARGI